MKCAGPDSTIRAGGSLSPLARVASRQYARFLLDRLLVDVDQAADGIGTRFAQRLPAARFPFAQFTLHFHHPRADSGRVTLLEDRNPEDVHIIF